VSELASRMNIYIHSYDNHDNPNNPDNHDNPLYIGRTGIVVLPHFLAIIVLIIPPVKHVVSKRITWIVSTVMSRVIRVGRGESLNSPSAQPCTMWKASFWIQIQMYAYNHNNPNNSYYFSMVCSITL